MTYEEYIKDMAEKDTNNWLIKNWCELIDRTVNHILNIKYYEKYNRLPTKEEYNTMYKEFISTLKC